MAEPAPRWRIRILVAVWILGFWLVALRGQNVAEQYLLAAANQDRTAHRLEPLRVDAQLSLAARTHAYEMARRKTILAPVRR